MSSNPLAERIVAALKKVPYPGYKRDIVAFGFVKGVEVPQEGRVIVQLHLPSAETDRSRAVEEGIRREVAALPGVRTLEVRIAAAEPGAAPAPQVASQPQGVKGVANLIAVASGKGGVGKSTVAVNLAVSLAGQGISTGLLDSDIYGPSVPLMMAIRGQPETKGNWILPLENHGVRTMSIGYLLPDDDSPVIWRGPMVTKALTQFLRQVEWGTLDYLVLDLPPGTGDAHLTLVQSIPLTGAIIVTTPQDVALIDARKAVAMFRKTGVPILGIVENMSLFSCPSCGHEEPIFGEGGGRREADRLQVPFLGSIPLEPRIREGGDRGIPVVVAEPASSAAGAFAQLTATVCKAVEAASA